MNSVGLPAFLEAVVSNAFINEAGQSLPSLAEQCTSLLAASHCQGLTNRLAPDQDGCRVDCCWLPAAEVPFAVNMPVDRMNQHHKGLSLKSTHSEEGCATDSPRNEVFGNANVVFIPD